MIEEEVLKLIDWLWVNNYIETDNMKELQRGINFYFEEVD